MAAGSGSRRLPPAATLIAAAALLLGAAGARAETVGFVWNSSPTSTGTFTPASLYSYNSAGGAISITHNGTGSYTVTFAGLGNGQSSNVEVTGYGHPGAYCNVQDWGSSSLETDV